MTKAADRRVDLLERVPEALDNLNLISSERRTSFGVVVGFLDGDIGVL